MPLQTINGIIAALQSEDADERSSALQAAGDLLREAAGIDTPEALAQDAEQLKQGVFNVLQSGQDPDRTAGLIFVLGKSYDARYKEMYLEFLRQSVSDLLTANAGVYQALIALDNLREPVFEWDERGRSSQSLTNVEENLRQARTYLAKHRPEISL